MGLRPQPNQHPQQVNPPDPRQNPAPDDPSDADIMRMLVGQQRSRNRIAPVPNNPTPRNFTNNTADMRFEQVQGSMAVVYAVNCHTNDGSFLMQGVIGTSRGLPFFLNCGYEHCSKLPVRHTSDEPRKNQMDGYDTNVLVVSFEKSQYALNNRAEILSLLQTTADWLHAHSYSNSTKLMRQENRTAYMVSPQTSIVTPNPMRKLDAVVLLSEAIQIIRSKFSFLCGTPRMDGIIRTYFTAPIPPEVFAAFEVFNDQLPRHNIIN